MTNEVTTNVDRGNVILAYGEFRDYTLSGTAADVIAEGTILAIHATNGNAIIFEKDGTTDGNGVPSVVMTYDVTIPSGGTIPIRACVGGVVRKERLIIDADNSASNVDNAVIDGLRARSIIPLDVFELQIQDNQ